MRNQIEKTHRHIMCPSCGSGKWYAKPSDGFCERKGCTVHFRVFKDGSMTIQDHTDEDLPTFGDPVIVEPGMEVVTGMKSDDQKNQHHLVDPYFLADLTKIMTLGVPKYAAFNWQLVLGGPGGVERYFDALMRHAYEFQKGNLNDTKTGMPHIAYVATNSMILHWATRCGLSMSDVAKGAINASED